MNNNLARSSTLFNKNFADNSTNQLKDVLGEIKSGAPFTQKEKKSELEQKREISKMYQYYNYLMLDKNKDSLK